MTGSRVNTLLQPVGFCHPLLSATQNLGTGSTTKPLSRCHPPMWEVGSTGVLFSFSCFLKVSGLDACYLLVPEDESPRSEFDRVNAVGALEGARPSSPEEISRRLLSSTAHAKVASSESSGCLCQSSSRTLCAAFPHYGLLAPWSLPGPSYPWRTPRSLDLLFLLA